VVTIPRDFVPHVAGVGQENVKKIEEQLGVRVHIPPPSGSDEWVIVGPKEGVQKAAELLRAAHQAKVRATSTLTINIDPKQHRNVIGRKGANIQEVFEKTGVSVHVPPPGAGSDAISLRGPPSSLAAAVQMVLEKANSVMDAELAAPAWTHRHVIGKKGTVLKEITKDCADVGVQFDKAKGLITLEGPPEVASQRTEGGGEGWLPARSLSARPAHGPLHAARARRPWRQRGRPWTSGSRRSSRRPPARRWSCRAPITGI
jgi:predicted RNA-binding protein YlqC (UPF0109 family)